MRYRYVWVVLLPLPLSLQRLITPRVEQGWATGRPAQAVDALRTAGAAVPGGGRIYWVSVNQTDARKPDNVTASGVVRQVVSHQYPAWYPEACDPKSIAGQETMFCSAGGPPVLECLCTVTKQ